MRRFISLPWARNNVISWFKAEGLIRFGLRLSSCKIESVSELKKMLAESLLKNRVLEAACEKKL
jgi:hypothetical protein